MVASHMEISVRHTLKSTRPVEAKLVPAAGMHLAGTRHTYLFDSFRVGKKIKAMLAIGRGSRCDIKIHDDPYVSRAHAVLSRNGLIMWIHDHDSTNGVYVNHQRITQPVGLMVGMQIQIGHTVLIAVDEARRFPIAAVTVSEICRKAARLYSSNQLAGDHVGRSREFVRRQHIVREQRLKSARDAATTRKTKRK
jgi:hypothetical protein